MIKREHYIERIRDFYDSDLIKIITGIRRCGKSVILEEIRDEISKSSNNIIYINFEDEETSAKINTYKKIIDYVDNNRKDGKCYVFLDEVQEIENWQKACKTLRLHNNSVFITGSNSKLLSSEFTKELSGRYVSFRIRPFVYKEIVDYSKQLNITPSISDYLVWGGFPKRFEFTTGKAQEDYLTDLNTTIIYNDLINRFKIENVSLFKLITNFVLKSNSRTVSARSIEGYIKNEHTEGSINTVIKYLGYLEEAFIIERIKPYSTRTKDELKYYFKIYDEDVSFNSIRCKDSRYDLTHNLKNIIYNELIYMGYDIMVLSQEDKEIDFIASNQNKKYYIQVAYSVLEEKTYNREFKAFDNLPNDGEKIIITNDDIDYSTSLVKHIKLKDFLLMDSL